MHINLKPYSKEHELLLLCSSDEMDERSQERINAIICNGINWELFSKITIHHKMIAVVRNRFKYFKNITSPDFEIYLKKRLLSNSKRNIFLTAYLKKTLLLLHENNILAVSLKGPVFAQQIYHDILYCSFSEFEIMIYKKDVIKTFLILKKFGFKDFLKLNKKRINRYISNEDHIILHNPNSNISIILKWELSGGCLNNPLMLESLEEYLLKDEFYGMDIQYFSIEVVFIYLCICGAKQYWMFFEQLNSVAELIKQYKNIDWAKVEKLSEKWRCRRMVFLGASLASKILKAPVPYHILSDISKDEDLTKLVAIIAKRFFSISFSKKFNSEWKYISFILRIRDTRMDGYKQLMRRIFKPTHKELHYFAVPPIFSFVYYFSRPFRLLGFWVRKDQHITQIDVD